MMTGILSAALALTVTACTMGTLADGPPPCDLGFYIYQDGGLGHMGDQAIDAVGQNEYERYVQAGIVKADMGAKIKVFDSVGALDPFAWDFLFPDCNSTTTLTPDHNPANGWYVVVGYTFEYSIPGFKCTYNWYKK